MMAKLRKLARKLGGHFYKDQPIVANAKPVTIKVATDADVLTVIQQVAHFGCYDNELGYPLYVHIDVQANARAWLASNQSGEINRASSFWQWAKERAELALNGHIHSSHDNAELILGNQAS